MAGKRIIAILDTMWGWGGIDMERAPAFFQINPLNHSGRRLYQIVGTRHRLLVTNCCKEYVSHSGQHGKPDAEWLRSNLAQAPDVDLILVCGSVAKKTFKPEFASPKAKVLYMDHPAARRWTKDRVEGTKAHIQRLLKGI